VLTRVDIRPVQFARESNEQLRYGFNLNLPIGDRSSPSSPLAENPGADGDDNAPSRPSRASSARPRVQLNFSHTYLIDSELLIREGLDPVDLLSRGAIGLGGATRPRHQIDLALGYSERGFGARLNGQHRGKSFLQLVNGGETDVLRFSPLTTLNLRTWVNPSHFAPQADWLKRSRLSLSIANLFNRRQRIRESEGLTPLAYQAAYRNALGRTIEVEYRKAF
jgi:iron complex outermembrane recepter protein